MEANVRTLFARADGRLLHLDSAFAAAEYGTLAPTAPSWVEDTGDEEVVMMKSRCRVLFLKVWMKTMQVMWGYHMMQNCARIMTVLRRLATCVN